MPTRPKVEDHPDLDFLKNLRQVNKRKIFIAIAVVIVLAVVAMTGVYYEYW